MVNLNGTLLVEVVLFLLFLWLMQRLVFRPILHVMDSRDEQVASDQERSDTVGAEAAALEREYAGKVSALHREASHTVYHAHRVAQDAHNQKVGELKRQEEAELAQVRAETAQRIDEQRAGFPALTDRLATSMAERLGLKERAS